jgi:hypothetical protein
VREFARRHADLAKVSLRPRRRHDLRRSFISLAQTDGATPHILKLCTHGEPKAVFDRYATFQWPVLCAEAAKLRVELREGQVLEMSESEREKTMFVERWAAKRWLWVST